MIPLENVSKVYNGNIVALRDASFDVAKGEFVFLGAIPGRASRPCCACSTSPSSPSAA